MALQHLRSSTADKRPTPGAMSDGQLALNTNLVSPGLFFKDSNGDSVKIGPVHVGTTAPNVTPGAGGQAGNSVGEAWLDTTAANPILKVFNGSAFVAVQPVGTGTVVSTTDTGTVTSTMILDGTILNADINASAAIADTKLGTIATGGKVSNSATTATNANTASAIVARDASGNFTAGTITAALTGAASSNVLKAGDTMTGDLVVPSINGGPLAGMRNAIINGGMQVGQRAAPTITGTPQYGQADRFVAFISGGTGISGTITQGTDAQFKSGYRLWLANLSYTNGTWAIQQRIESFNSVGLNGSTVTVSFKVYHDFGSSRTLDVNLSKANAVDNFSAVTSISSNYTSPALTSGAYSNVSCSFAIGASDATNGILLQIADSSATTVSAKNIIIGDVQLEVGPVATPFERRPIGTELALCQRYFQERICVHRNDNSNSGTASIDIQDTFPVRMRTTPTATVISTSGTTNFSSPNYIPLGFNRGVFIGNKGVSSPSTSILQVQVTLSAEL